MYQYTLIEMIKDKCLKYIQDFERTNSKYNQQIEIAKHQNNKTIKSFEKLLIDHENSSSSYTQSSKESIGTLLNDEIECIEKSNPIVAKKVSKIMNLMCTTLPENSNTNQKGSRLQRTYFQSGHKIDFDRMLENLELINPLNISPEYVQTYNKLVQDVQENFKQQS